MLLFLTVYDSLTEFETVMKKKKKLTQLDIIKSVRRELPPKGQTFLAKKDKLHRKRKHKGKIDTGE